MFKEKINNPEQEYITLIEKTKRVISLWHEVGGSEPQTSEGLWEDDIRREEEDIIPSLINFIKINPDFIKNKKEEINFIVSEYLKMGDCINLMKEIADLLKIEFHDPFEGLINAMDGGVKPEGAAKQILRELGEETQDIDPKKLN